MLLDKIITVFVVLVTIAIIIAVSTAPNQEPINRSKQLPGISRHFTDQFIFRRILGHFSPENRISTMSMSAFEV